MKIEFQCENCKSVLRLDSVHAGRPARCPVCGTVSQVPGQQTLPAEESSDWRPLGEQTQHAASRPEMDLEPVNSRKSHPDSFARTQAGNQLQPPQVQAKVGKDGLWVLGLVLGIVSIVVHFVLCGCGSFISPVFAICGFCATLLTKSRPRTLLVILNGIGLLFTLLALGSMILAIAF